MKQWNKISIVTTDIYNNKSYKLYSGKFTSFSKIKSSKKDILLSYVANRDLIIEFIEVSNHIEQDNIVDVITDKVYEELLLDPAIEYEIYSVKTALHSNETSKYQVFIIDKNSLRDSFISLAKRVKVIDYIFAAPLLYKVLYATNRLKSSSTDMFIYFGEYDSFISFYHKGEYLYSKSIKFSLQQIYDRFCQHTQDAPLSKEQFKNFLENYDLKRDNSENKELLATILNESFLTINDVLIYTKRTYNLQDIKTAYISFSWGYIFGIESYVSNYLNLEGKSLNSIFDQEVLKVSVDPMHFLMALSALEMKNRALELPNLTPYARALPLFKRAVGKALSILILSIIIFQTPIIYDYIIVATTQAKNRVLTKKEAKVTTVANRYKKVLKSKREELKTLEQAVNKTKSLFLSKKEELKNIYNTKFKYNLRSEQLALVTNLLKDYNIKIESIEINDTLYKIEVESKESKEITASIKKLVFAFGKKISNIDIKSIKYNSKNSIYQGVIKLEFTKGSK